MKRFPSVVLPNASRDFVRGTHSMMPHCRMRGTPSARANSIACGDHTVGEQVQRQPLFQEDIFHQRCRRIRLTRLTITHQLQRQLILPTIIMHLENASLLPTSTPPLPFPTPKPRRIVLADVENKQERRLGVALHGRPRLSQNSPHFRRRVGREVQAVWHCADVFELVQQELLPLRRLNVLPSQSRASLASLSARQKRPSAR